MRAFRKKSGAKRASRRGSFGSRSASRQVTTASMCAPSVAVGHAPVTVIVGERASAPTAARWALPDVDAVRRWLQALEQRLRAA